MKAKNDTQITGPLKYLKGAINAYLGSWCQTHCVGSQRLITPFLHCNIIAIIQKSESRKDVNLFVDTSISRDTTQ